MAKATRIEAGRWWEVAGEPYVTLVLDKNEALAVRNATREYHDAALRTDITPPTSLNGAGARVYVAMKASIAIEVV